MAAGRRADQGGAKRPDELDDELLDDGDDAPLDDDEGDDGPTPRAAAGPAPEEQDGEADPEAEAEATRFADAAEREAGGSSEKPALLQAIEKLLADPAEIRLDVEKQRVRTRRRTKLDGRALDRAVADDLITSYSRRTMLVGGASALAGVVPGLGSVVGLFGTAIADAALSMKFEIELVLAIATAFGRDVTIEHERDACILVAGLGTLAEVGKFTGKKLTKRAFLALVRKVLSGNLRRWILIVFSLLGWKLAPKALLGAIPLGLGLVLNVLMNRTVTRIVGARAVSWFASTAA